VAPRRDAVYCGGMDGIVGALARAAGIFAGTNIDDLVLLTVLFLSARARGVPTVWQIWVGQFAGIAALVVVSVVAALGLTLVPDGWVCLLGLVPLSLGLWKLVQAIRQHNFGGGGAPRVATGLLGVAGWTFANGGDNVSVYAPVFRTIGLADTLITIAVFGVGVALWCPAASLLGSHKKVIEIVDRFGHWIVPGVFIVIGLYLVTK
jgi:cadmium resistance protein CadD (predicted permease)